MEQVTYQGKKGFYDSSSKAFYDLDILQKVTKDGQKGYYSEPSGFIPVDVQEQPQVSTGNVSPEIANYKLPNMGFSRQDNQTEQGGFIPNLTEKIGERLGNIKTEASTLGVESKKPKTERNQFGEFSSLLSMAGEVGGIVGDTFNEGVKSIYKTATPENVQKEIGNFATGFIETFKKKASEPTQQGAILSAGLDALKGGVEMWNAFEQENPNAAKDIKAMGNIAIAVPVVKGTSTLLKGTSNILKDLTSLATQKTVEGLDTSIASEVQNAISKSIKPTFGKGELQTRGFKTIQDYYQKAGGAVKSIVSNKNNLEYMDEVGNLYAKGRLPATLNEFSQAISQTRKKIYEQYSTISKLAGGKGLQISSDDTVKELMDIAENPLFQTEFPDIAKYAFEAAESRRGIVYSPEKVEDIIRIHNQKLTNVINGQASESTAKLYVESVINNSWKKSLNKTINDLTGEEYSVLKKQYGQLKEIEGDVGKSLQKFMNADEVGFIEGLESIATTFPILRGLLKKDPATFLAGAGSKLVQQRIKHLNSPNKLISGMFEKTEKLLEESKGFSPKSSLFKTKSKKADVLPPEQSIGTEASTLQNMLRKK